MASQDEYHALAENRRAGTRNLDDSLPRRGKLRKDFKVRGKR